MKQLYLLFCLLIIISCEKDKSLNTPPKILQLNFEGVKSISTNIDSSSKIITVEVPYQTSISTLVPIIGLEDGVTVVPASGLAQNFAQDVYYTLSKNSNKLIYTVKVKVANQPKPEITLIKTDTVEAGNDLSIAGKNFGKFSLDILAFLVDNENKESLLKHQLIDSTQIKLTTSIDQKVGFYRIKVKIKNQEVIADTKIWLAYPSPQLTSIPRFNLLKGDTLWLIGKYIDASKYNFLCQLSNRNATYQLAMTKSLPNQLGFILPNYVTFGEYEVKIYNASEKKLSGTMASPISIYEPSLPYVNGILNYQLFYKNNDKLIFKTSNFDKIAARFYQVSLVGSDKTFLQNCYLCTRKKQQSQNYPRL